ncbi:DUF262 domain-containing protein [Spiroplasma diminutum]|uniref:DUF262 domain-containing protein n=1 Tax=Spiroplasma diminutum CUAS-1 TaxID=1276221 RepID=S5M091_9MOLU|nr:DUF262 domain-containing protein [Spiroplasma diminutum]AGR42261.1 hypothetical protein SDIMI_v3c05570 [Spiroplasma diminutum CUAS-1]
MIRGKAWNIATNFGTYINEYAKASCFKKGDILLFSTTPNGKELKVKINNKEVNIIKKGEKSTFLQILRVWCTLDFIRLKNAEFIEKLDYFFEYEFQVNHGFNEDLHKQAREIIEKRLSGYTNYSFKDEFTFYNGFSIATYIQNELEEKSNDEDIKKRINTAILKCQNKDDFLIDDIDDIKNNKSLQKLLSTYKVKGIYNNKKIIQLAYKYIYDEKWTEYYKINDVENMFINESFKKYEINNENLLEINFTFNGENLIYSKNYSLGEFLGEFFLKSGSLSKIAIPIYQRQYNWDENLALGLLWDILNLSEGEYHYIGGIVLYIPKRERVNNKLIDGQQRLTTCLIMLRQIYNVFLMKDYKIPTILNSLFRLNEYEENVVTKTFKRIDTNSDFRAFNNVMKGDQIIETTSSVFSNSVAIFSVIKDFNEIELLKCFKKIYEQLMLSVTTDHISNEYTLFENLNTKSLQLSIMDLIKNFLFMNIDSKVVDDHEQQLQLLFEQDITMKFKEFKNPENKMQNFINVFLRLKGKEYSSSSSFESFKTVLKEEFISKRNLKSFDESRKLFSDLGKYIDLYILVSDAETFNKQTSLTYYFKDILLMLEGREIYYPLIIKILLNFDYINNQNDKELTRQLRKILFEIEKYEVRLQVSNYKGQSLSTFIDESILSKIGESVFTPEYLRLLFIGEHEDESNNRVSIERFQSSLIDSDISSKIATLIGYRIENYLSNNKDLFSDGYNYIDTKYEKRTLEHIVPQRPKNEWFEDIIKWSEYSMNIDETKRWKTKYLNKLGNLMCIEGKSNSKIQNKVFSEKITDYSKEGKINSSFQFKGYKDSEFELMDLRKLDSFYTDSIELRTKQLAKICCSIWKDKN